MEWQAGALERSSMRKQQDYQYSLPEIKPKMVSRGERCHLQWSGVCVGGDKTMTQRNGGAGNQKRENSLRDQADA
jgi:hypothetical protein